MHLMHANIIILPFEFIPTCFNWGFCTLVYILCMFWAYQYPTNYCSFYYTWWNMDIFVSSWVITALSVCSYIEIILQKQASNKLPIMYLLDSIVKNVGENYKPLFSKNIVSTFKHIFEKVRYSNCNFNAVIQNAAVTVTGLIPLIISI